MVVSIITERKALYATSGPETLSLVKQYKLLLSKKWGEIRMEAIKERAKSFLAPTKVKGIRGFLAVLEYLDVFRRDLRRILGVFGRDGVKFYDA